MLLTKQQLLARVMASDDETRFNITHLQIEPARTGNGGTVRATNGHLAVVVTSRELPEDGAVPVVPRQGGTDPDRAVYLHAAAATAGAKIVPSKSDMPGFQIARLRVEEGVVGHGAAARLSLGASDTLTPQIVLTDEPVEMRYPAIDSVFPQGEARAQVLLSAKYLKLIAAYCEKFAHADRAAVRLTIYEPGQGVVFDWADPRHEVRGVLMPMLDSADRRAAVANARTPEEREAARLTTPMQVPDPGLATPGVTPLAPDTLQGVDDALARAALNAREKAAAARLQRDSNSGGPDPARVHTTELTPGPGNPLAPEGEAPDPPVSGAEATQRARRPHRRTRPLTPPVAPPVAEPAET